MRGHSCSTIRRTCSSTVAHFAGPRAVRLCSGNSPTTGRSRLAPPAPLTHKPRQFFTLGIVMATSTPTPPDPESSPAIVARHEKLDTVAAQVAAIDELIGLAHRSIRVFDVDLSGMGWNE